MRIFLDSSLKSVPKDDLSSAIETIFQQLEDQINSGTQVSSLTDSNQILPEGMKSGDLVVNLQRGELRVGLFNGIEVVYASFGSFTGAITDLQHGPRAGGLLHPVATSGIAGFQSTADKVKQDHFKGFTDSSGPPTTTHYPVDEDWGFYFDTIGLVRYLAINRGGTIYTTLLT